MIWDPVFMVREDKGYIYEIMFTAKNYNNWLNFEEKWVSWIIEKLTVMPNAESAVLNSPLY
jgi:hypothetical protein